MLLSTARYLLKKLKAPSVPEALMNSDAMDEFLKSWRPQKNDDGSDRYEGLFVILRPNGSKVASFPTWPVSENVDRAELKVELHKWVDCVVDMIDD